MLTSSQMVLCLTELEDQAKRGNKQEVWEMMKYLAPELRKLGNKVLAERFEDMVANRMDGKMGWIAELCAASAGRYKEDVIGL